MEYQNDPGRRRDAFDDLQKRVEAALNDLRPKVRRVFEEFESNVDSAMADLRPKVDAKMKEARPRVDSFVADVQPKMDEALRKVQRKLEELRVELENRAARAQQDDVPVDYAASDSAETAGPAETGGSSRNAATTGTSVGGEEKPMNDPETPIEGPSGV